MESKVPYFEKMLKQKSIARKQFSPQKLTYITAKGLGKLVDELDKANKQASSILKEAVGKK